MDPENLNFIHMDPIDPMKNLNFDPKKLVLTSIYPPSRWLIQYLDDEVGLLASQRIYRVHTAGPATSTKW